MATVAALVVVALKWALMGRYSAGERPLWSRFVWRTELVSAMHENLADPLLNEPLKGTPFVAWFFRALGASIGRRPYMGTTQLTEYDLVRIGDDVCVNEDATLQTHLFEDRVMKMSSIRIGDKCTIGSQSIVLYGARMESGSTLGHLSLLMKGEALPERTRWEGSPAALAR
jgi:non-ribosomal peptide synthetase-like protein